MIACIEIISTEETSWVVVPNKDLSTAISNFTGDRDYVVAIITGYKKGERTTFVNNCFHKCDIFELNTLILDLEENYHFDSNDIANLSMLNLLLENQNCDVKEVGNIIRDDRYRIFHEADDMGDVAMEVLEDSSWYQNAKDNFHEFDGYFDFKSYGEEILEPNGTYLHDKYNKIIIEVFE